MKYFKINKESSGYRIKNTYLVGEELYTMKQVERLGIKESLGSIVEVNKNNTLYIFGCRFEKKWF